MCCFFCQRLFNLNAGLVLTDFDVPLQTEIKCLESILLFIVSCVQNVVWWWEKNPVQSKTRHVKKHNHDGTRGPDQYFYVDQIILFLLFSLTGQQRSQHTVRNHEKLCSGLCSHFLSILLVYYTLSETRLNHVLGDL